MAFTAAQIQQLNVLVKDTDAMNQIVVDIVDAIMAGAPANPERVILLGYALLEEVGKAANAQNPVNEWDNFLESASWPLPFFASSVEPSASEKTAARNQLTSAVLSKITADRDTLNSAINA